LPASEVRTNQASFGLTPLAARWRIRSAPRSRPPPPSRPRRPRPLLRLRLCFRGAAVRRRSTPGRPKHFFIRLPGARRSCRPDSNFDRGWPSHSTAMGRAPRSSPAPERCPIHDSAMTSPPRPCARGRVPFGGNGTRNTASRRGGAWTARCAPLAALLARSRRTRRRSRTWSARMRLPSRGRRRTAPPSARSTSPARAAVPVYRRRPGSCFAGLPGSALVL
jgi:hypothetical protein